VRVIDKEVSDSAHTNHSESYGSRSLLLSRNPLKRNAVQRWLGCLLELFMWLKEFVVASSIVASMAFLSKVFPLCWIALALLLPNPFRFLMIWGFILSLLFLVSLLYYQHEEYRHV